MRTFTFLILFVNLGYLVWNLIMQAEDDSVYSAEQSSFMPAAQSLVLLSEVPPLSPDNEDAVLPMSEEQTFISSDPAIDNGELALGVPVQPGEPDLSCAIVSGFANQTEAEAFIAEIADGGAVGVLEIRQEQISSTWWVHLPPFKSQLDAQVVIEELVAKDIENFYMRTGELAGGISLGVFSREESATTAQTQLRTRGYETSVKEIPRYVSKAYVMVEASDSSSSGSGEWRAFLAVKPNLVATEKLCETIAR